ncbi:hypothetical protein [Chitinivorax sp. B]|uniref:hypothetical protein n=1 Tax=Chitinivorax sp. B TaxID=2502235 RepID=UPI0010F840CD|nr:hypothetical protein [Chitinivorax sp. B]
MADLPGDVKVLQVATRVDVHHGYARLLPAHSKWRHVGSLRQRAVYRSEDSVFSIRGANTHEAYLVVNNNQLVGYYLPGEKAFSPLSKVVDLNWEDNK